MKKQVWYVLNYMPIIPGVFDIQEIPEEEFIICVKNKVEPTEILLSKKEERYLRKMIPSVKVRRLGNTFDQTKEFVEGEILYHEDNYENILLVVRREDNRCRYFRCEHQCNDRLKIGWSEERQNRAKKELAYAVT